jgi:hypothetical protein
MGIHRFFQVADVYDSLSRLRAANQDLRRLVAKQTSSADVFRLLWVAVSEASEDYKVQLFTFVSCDYSTKIRLDLIHEIFLSHYFCLLRQKMQRNLEDMIHFIGNQPSGVDKKPLVAKVECEELCIFGKLCFSFLFRTSLSDLGRFCTHYM